MKRMLAMILCCLLLTACGTSPVETTRPTGYPPETVATAPPGNILTVYAPNEDATGFIYTSLEVPERNAKAICYALISVGVLKDDVAFNSLILESREIKLDVNQAFLSQLRSYGTTGEYMMVGSVVNTLLSIYAADSVFITCDGEIMESGHVVYDFPLEFYQDQTAAPLNDLTPMIMVDGLLYLDTGRESTVTARCGIMDGTIESQVDSWLEPTENNQSNFAVGFDYQYGAEPGTIDVNIEGNWYVYATEDVKSALPQ